MELINYFDLTGRAKKQYSRVLEPDSRKWGLNQHEQGRTIAQEGREAQRSYFTELYRGITPEEVDQWRRITQKVCENIESFDKG